MSPLDNPSATQAAALRSDLALIAGMVEPGARVLDIGCSDGALLDHLARHRQVVGRGMELSQRNVNACVARGLSVIQGDADTDLGDYPSDAFDYAILSLTLQATRDPRQVLEQMARIGRHAIVSFPNFGHWRVRLHLAFRGRMPVTDSIPEAWYETPNIHFCTIRDFTDLCHACGMEIEETLVLGGDRLQSGLGGGRLANLLGEKAIFRLKKD
ncbi:methionine biosynthesis protein MetW [Pelagibius litoralis]|uniref:Methionine biosynthesis protein MetW n=1 Tax=Pelagibius litoralis TaxID=374515 RepID=A0A967EVA7_9PROT|nr:methionine biosynthesis protein MetW [Pelagibius litoralis]NIA68406.1 methionine biosynthesis protein MetW [Pelagibius litoralis]